MRFTGNGITNCYPDEVDNFSIDHCPKGLRGHIAQARLRGRANRTLRPNSAGRRDCRRIVYEKRGRQRLANVRSPGNTTSRPGWLNENATLCHAAQGRPQATTVFNRIAESSPERRPVHMLAMKISARQARGRRRLSNGSSTSWTSPTSTRRSKYDREERSAGLTSRQERRCQKSATRRPTRPPRPTRSATEGWRTGNGTIRATSSEGASSPGLSPKARGPVAGTTGVWPIGAHVVPE